MPKIHGMYKTAIYRSWVEMRRRCQNPNRAEYKNYGGRGIGICKAWESFEQFYADMGERPEGTSLHRVKTNGHYCNSNCVWATPREQASNRRTSRPDWVGVSQRGKKFRAHIYVDGKKIWLGTFSSQKEARAAYLAAAEAEAIGTRPIKCGTCAMLQLARSLQRDR